WTHSDRCSAGAQHMHGPPRSNPSLFLRPRRFSSRGSVFAGALVLMMLLGSPVDAQVDAEVDIPVQVVEEKADVPAPPEPVDPPQPVQEVPAKKTEPAAKAEAKAEKKPAEAPEAEDAKKKLPEKPAAQ